MRSLAIFDLDGVIIDSETTAAEVLAWQLTTAGYPVSIEEVIDRFIGTAIPGILQLIATECGMVWPPGFHRDLEREVRRHVFERILPTEGMAEVLSALMADGWCIASNSDADRIEKCFELSGLATRFRPPMFSAAMVNRGKPAPDLFLLAAATLGFEPNRCIVVEDTVVGVTAGKRAGMRVIGFVGGSHIKEPAQVARLIEAGAEDIAKDGAMLARVLRRHGCMALPA
jgi:HAD superfamily hydrolase (TIGR01509 family)